MRDFMKPMRIIITGLLCLLIAAAIAGCGSEKKETKTDKPSPLMTARGWTGKYLSNPGYEAWREYRDDYLTVYCPPSDNLISRTEAIADKIKQIFLENSIRLQVPIPKPVTFYLYNNNNELQELTGCEHTCLAGDTVHYMIYTPLGEPIMVLLLKEFAPDGTTCPFCFEGTYTLLDYSMKNYVEEAYIDHYNGELPTLGQLLDPEVYPALDSIHRCNAAASLTQFLLDQPWNPEMFLSIYKSTQDTKIALENMYKMPLDSLEHQWIQYLKDKSGLNVEY